MKTLSSIIAAAIVFSLTSLNAMTPSSASLVEQTIMKQAIDSKLNYHEASKALNVEGTVDVTVFVNSENEMQVTYIDGNPDLSEYVQANLDNSKLNYQLKAGTSYDFDLRFTK